MPHLEIDDFELYYETHGSGPPLLLVTGLGGLAEYWRPQLADFGRHFTLITHDHRGAGQSTHSRIAYSVDQMADDVLKLMDALGIDSAHLVGHSMGGAIGQTIAIEKPSRLASLTLYATWTKADPFMRRVFDARKALLSGAGPAAYVHGTAMLVYPHWWINENDERLAALDRANLARLPSPEIVLSRCDAVLSFDRISELGRISVPTLVVCADDDFLTPSYFSRELASIIPRAELRIIDRGGHVCSQVVPQEFNEIVLRFLLSR